jgi:signal transduction histidine kinase
VTARGRAGGGFSVEQPLWRAVSAFRLLTLLYAVGTYPRLAGHYQDRTAGWVYLGLLAAWTFATVRPFSSKLRCGWGWLYTDLAAVVAGILLTRVFDSHAGVLQGDPTLPTIRAAGAVLGFAVMGGWLPAAVSGLAVGLADIVEAGGVTASDLHNIVLLMLAGVAIGYVIEVARASELTLARALEIQAVTRERERLARDIHDGVLQVLAMVQRRGSEAGGEAAELGRMAGEQERALRALIAEGLAPNPSYVAPVVRRRSRSGPDAATAGPGADPSDLDRSDLDPSGAGSDGGAAEQDLRSLIAPLAGARVTVSAPGTPVLLPGHAVRELGAAVGAALDNVRRHAGEQAQAWILVEDEPDEVVVSIRDDGPGFDAAARLGEAEREGRLGVSQSIRGRLRDLGGSADLFSAPGQGTEIELRVPRGAAGTATGTAAVPGPRTAGSPVAGPGTNEPSREGSAG